MEKMTTQMNILERKVLQNSDYNSKLHQVYLTEDPLSKIVRRY